MFFWPSDRQTNRQTLISYDPPFSRGNQSGYQKKNFQTRIGHQALIYWQQSTHFSLVTDTTNRFAAEWTQIHDAGLWKPLRDHFLKNPIFIGHQVINENRSSRRDFWRDGTRIRVPGIEKALEMRFSGSWISMFFWPRQTNRTEWYSDSSSWHRKTSRNVFFWKLNFDVLLTPTNKHTHTHTQTFFSLDPPFSRGNKIRPWDVICFDYQLQKQCRKSDEITTPFGFPANVRSIFVWPTNKCRIIGNDLFDQLNSNSCFPHRETSGKLVSRELDLHWLPVYHSHSSQPDRGFEFAMSQIPWEPNFGEIRVYRLPSNHCRPRQTDPGFEFPTSQYPLRTKFRWNPGISVA